MSMIRSSMRMPGRGELLWENVTSFTVVFLSEVVGASFRVRADILGVCGGGCKGGLSVAGRAGGGEKACNVWMACFNRFWLKRKADAARFSFSGGGGKCLR